jgi:hypothetical protein
MDTKNLLRRVRKVLDDVVGSSTDKLWSDQELIDDYANDVIREMCRRTRRLIKDSTTVGEVLATGTITLTGSAGQITSVKVDGSDILTGPITYDTSPTVTAAAVALAVNNYTYVSTYYGVQYSATSALGVVTLTADAGSGATPNGHVITVVAAGGLTATVTAISGGDSMCQMYLIEGQDVYEKNDKILEIVSAYATGQSVEITRVNDVDYPRYNTATGAPSGMIEDSSSIRFVPIPNQKYTVNLTAYCIPVTDLDYTVITREPGIPSLYHADIIPGILQMCFEKNDEEAYRPQLAAKYEDTFRRRCNRIGQELINRTGGPTTQGYKEGLI